MFRIAQGAGLRQYLLQNFLALDERQLAQIVAREGEQVEYEQRRRRLDRRTLHVGPPGQLGARLQLRETRVAGFVQHHELAIENHIFIGNGLDRARELRERAREVQSLARIQDRFAVLAGGTHAIAVELHLEQPPGLGKRLIASLGEHELRVLDPQVALRRAEFLELLLDRLGPLLRVAQLVVRQSREHGLVGIRLCGDVLVPLLDEQPLFRSLLEFDQRPPAVKFVAFQLKQQFSFFKSCLHVFEGNPYPSIPDDHGSSAVVPFRNDPLEVTILERVILNFYREALVGRICGRALGDRPRHEDAIQFEPQIPMQPRRIVHVHDQ